MDRTTGIPDTKEIQRVAFASAIGCVIEWYDFFLYGVVAGLVFNKLFFPTCDPMVGTLLAFATYALGFVARPLGGLVFGQFAGYLLDHGFNYSHVLVIAGSLHVVGYLLLLAVVRSLKPLPFDSPNPA